MCPGWELSWGGRGNFRRRETKKSPNECNKMPALSVHKLSDMLVIVLVSYLYGGEGYESTHEQRYGNGGL